ncbi:MAG: NAD-dependent epimerase/dehydratase family protein [Bacteroidetes bacterium]|nr:NAD-dependent epimerase/dehydratase family protein [Bacteroidota bacterium]
MIFVTGATGLLGTHVLAELSRRNLKIRALKRRNSDLTAARKLFDYYFGETGPQKFQQIEWVEGDILDICSLQKGIAGCSVVYHCAALVSFRRRDFRKLVKLNKEGTANVVNVCLGAGIDHLCYVSSTAAIGRSAAQTVYRETNKWVTDPENSGYAISKYSAENEVWRGVEEGLNAVIVNPSVILGPGNWNESSLSIFKVIKKGLRFYTPGMNAFVDARDVAFVMAELSEKRIFNDRFLVIAENLKYRDLFVKIADAFGVKGPSIEAKPWMAAIVWRLESFLTLFGKKQNITRETAHSSMSISQYSNEKIKAKIGMKFRTMEDTVNNTVTFFNQYN